MLFHQQAVIRVLGRMMAAVSKISSSLEMTTSPVQAMKQSQDHRVEVLLRKCKEPQAKVYSENIMSWMLIKGLR